jgi:uncharacterized protein (DUF433 family)/DNA-binding transcriptional MerR regulator
MRDASNRHLISLGEGVYTVSQVCRVLQPSMTPRKVHYWVDTKLLSEPISHGRRGHPTLLSFQQLLEIRTVQRLRDELGYPLPKVRSAFEWILDHLFEVHWRNLHFERGESGVLVARSGDHQLTVPGGQGVLDLIPELNREIAETREAWDARLFHIPNRPYVVSNARVLAGAPTIKGTRMETSILAAFATEGEITRDEITQVARLYARLPRAAIEDAITFEGVRIAA